MTHLYITLRPHVLMGGFLWHDGRMKAGFKSTLRAINRGFSTLFTLLLLLIFIGLICPFFLELILKIAYQVLRLSFYIVYQTAVMVQILLSLWKVFAGPLLFYFMYLLSSWTVSRMLNNTAYRTSGYNWLATGMNCSFLLALCGYAVAMIE